jgi:hypothetical protein
LAAVITTFFGALPVGMPVDPVTVFKVVNELAKGLHTSGGKPISPQAAAKSGAILAFAIAVAIDVPEGPEACR